MSASGRGRSPVVVKLGGSVLTRKRENERPRPKVLARLAAEVARAGERPLVLLHGAGSFGHPGALRFGLARAPSASDPPGQRARGAAIVAAEVRRLHLLVLRALVAAGARPASVPIATHAWNREGQLARFDPTPFAEALERGRLPVSFGDVVPDERWGESILSADTIAEALVRPLAVERVIFVSDVPGVWEGPRSGRRSIAPDVTEATLDGLSARPGATDVTGGIRRKVAAMVAIARLGADAGLISGLTDGALSRALEGGEVYGSWARGRRG